MKGFLKTTFLLLAGALGGALGLSYHFNVPINFNPITVFNTGDGKVEIKNEVNQGGAPSPSPSPATPAASTATPEAPPKVAQSAPLPEHQQPQSADMGGDEPEEAAPVPAAVRRRPPSALMSYEPDSEEQPQPVYADYTQQPAPRRSCPTVVMRRTAEAPPEIDTESWPQPSNTGRSYSRSSSSSVVRVNGRVVSSSSVTIVNGKVVSKSVYPPPPADDDDQR